MAAAAYPSARRQDLAEEIRDRIVSDPYRWLEDADSEETRSWLAAQDLLLAEYMAELPDRQPLATRITELLGAGYIGAPVWRGERQFYTRRAAGQEHAVLYTATPADGERILIDPMTIDGTGTTTLDAWQPDRDGRLLAYQLSQGGDEESLLWVMDVATGENVDGPIDRCRYTHVAWLPGGKAFYYSRRLPPEAVPDGEEQYHRRVYLHQLGGVARDDVMIFGDGLEKTSYYSVDVSRDGRWLIISAAAGTAPRNDVWIADLAATPESAPELRVVQRGVDAQTGAHVARDGRLYLWTDRDAPRGRLAVTDPAEPGYGHWRDLVPQDPEAVLADFAILDGQELSRPVLLVSWTRHAISEVSVHDLATGERTGVVPLPGLGTIGGLSERPEGGHESWFGYTDYTTPQMVLRYDALAGTTAAWERAPGLVEVPEISTSQVAYPSKDGTIVRMLIVSGRGGAPGGPGDAGPGDHETRGPGEAGPVDPRAGGRRPRPAILYGYGGFGISMRPAYNPSILAWVERGGVYAIAALRGGGDEGEDWHRAGMRARKQNVFDDFHAAAEKLIADGWTTRERLAISGGSNGGLLVGAAITQRPDLYAVAACSAPLLDMVRYERFGLGQTWNDEYGTADDAEQLGWLLSYSPYHQVRDQTSYPAVLFTVFDRDTRVDPMHARKMCAALQHATSARWPDRPILLRRESDVGHGARAVSRSASLAADTLAFLASQTQFSR
jgi:prolyl oligopeptidase